MGKRSDFERIEKDQYLTPESAVKPLIPFLPRGRFTFAEPCAGDGRLIRHIEALTSARCVSMSDIAPNDYAAPQIAGIMQRDARELTFADLNGADAIITNPPWSRDKKSGYLLHNLITIFANLRPTWLLFDADWMHTVQAQPFLADYCTHIVSVGRVKWMEGTNQTGKDNVAWYAFGPEARRHTKAPLFYGRGITP